MLQVVLSKLFKVQQTGHDTYKITIQIKSAISYCIGWCLVPTETSKAECSSDGGTEHAVED